MEVNGLRSHDVGQVMAHREVSKMTGALHVHLHTSTCMNIY